MSNCSSSPSAAIKSSIPRLPVNPREHKVPIAIAVGTTLLGSGVLPLTLYFTLTYLTSWPLSTILSIPASIFGVVSLLSLITRTVLLAKPSSTCRPLGSRTARTLDYYGWNFLVGFLGISAVITIGLSVPSLPSMRFVGMSLPLLMVQICAQLVLFVPLRRWGVRAPFRLSSVQKGEELLPAVYVIAEDVVAVDAGQGDVFRAAWKARYEASPLFGELLARLDVLWGISGLVVASALFGVVWGVGNQEVGWAVAWSVPWVWAGSMTVMTIQMTKRMCRKEEGMAEMKV